MANRDPERAFGSPRCPVEHGSVADFRDAAGIWTCSHCGNRDRWSSTWSWYGTLECPGCWRSDAIENVACSPACRKALGGKWMPEDLERESAR